MAEGMAKYSEEIVNKICELISTGDYTIKDVCKQVGISKETFYSWRKEKPDFSDLYKKAEEERLESFKIMTRSGIAKHLNGYEYDEETIEYVTDNKGAEKTKSRKVVRKYIMPNPTILIFSATNLDSENFKHMQYVKSDINFEKLSDEQLDKLFEKVMSGLKDNQDEQQ
jgi:hypothetical protein